MDLATKLRYQGYTSNRDIHPLNSDCIAGFYVSFHQLALFEKFEFFIPEKLDWLVIPHHDVDWISYSSALSIIETAINNQRSPLVWIKDSKDQLSKCFIAYW